jgi:hypothetical protein
MNHRKIGAWCLMFLGLISPIVASGYLFVEYPILNGYFITLFPRIRSEVAAILLAGAACFFFGLILWIVDFTLRRAKSETATH